MDTMQQRTLNNRDVATVVSKLNSRAKSSMEVRPRPSEQIAAQLRADTPDEQPMMPAAAPASVPLTRETPLLHNTSRRQRQLIGDRQWIKMVDDDRVAGAQGRLQERQDHHSLLMSQRRAFDMQRDEHRAEAERERQRRVQAQLDMDNTIANNRAAAAKEKADAYAKAMREKQFRESQATELEHRREQTRTNEHNDQVRHMMMVRNELERQRQDDADRKLRQKSEWRQVQLDNQSNLDLKARQSDAARELDRAFQKAYSDSLDKQESDRQQAHDDFEARAHLKQVMARKTASLHMKKEQNHDAKIEGEYQEQLQRALDTENLRKKNFKDRISDTHRVLDRQVAGKKQQDERDAADARALKEAMGQQAVEMRRQEANRKGAARAEAQRTMTFLNTQLQMQHFKETQAPETSITRPESRGHTMYSPSRYTPSLKPTF
jgi:hypothetical protein